MFTVSFDILKSVITSSALVLFSVNLSGSKKEKPVVVPPIIYPEDVFSIELSLNSYSFKLD